jgi:hypothetical protein
VSGRLFDYQPSGESVASCLAVLERGLEKFEKHGRVIAASRVSRDAGQRGSKPRTWTKGNPMPEAVREQIGREYMGHEPLRVIAARHRCAICTVTVVAAELGLPPRAAGRRSDLRGAAR